MWYFPEVNVLNVVELEPCKLLKAMKDEHEYGLLELGRRAKCLIEPRVIFTQC